MNKKKNTVADLLTEKKEVQPQDEILQISLSYWNEAKDLKEPIKKTWDAMWQLYNNVYDFSEKSPWQSKTIIPKLPSAVKGASALLKRSLIRAKIFFTLVITKMEWEIYKPALIKNLFAQLRKCKFVSNFIESLNAGLLSSLMIFKVYWEPAYSEDEMTGTIQPAEGINLEKKPSATQNVLQQVLGSMGIEQKKKLEEGRLRVDPIDPYDFFIGPRKQYCIHRYKIELYKLKELAEIKANKYETEIVDQLEAGISTELADYEKLKREGKNPQPLSAVKTVTVKEFWGNVVDAKGELVKRNCTWSIVNDSYVLRKPIANEFLHGLWPFVYGPLVRKPFSDYHKGFFEDGYSLAKSLTDTYNITADTNAFASLNAFEIDVDQIHDPEQLKTGIYPGKVLVKSSGGIANLPLVREIGLGKFNPQNLRLYQEADREWQNSNGLTEFLMGKPASRGRPTATEVTEKGQQAASQIEDLALDVEDYIFVPLLEMIIAVLIQYQRDFSDLRLLKFNEENIKFMEALAFMSDKEKRKLFKDKVFQFDARGMSDVINKSGNYQKVQAFLGLVKDIPAIAEQLKLDYFVKLLIEGMDWDPDDVKKTPEEMQAQRQAQQQAQMQAQQQQQQAAQAQAQQQAQQTQQQLQQQALLHQQEISQQEETHRQKMTHQEQVHQLALLQKQIMAGGKSV